MNKGIWAIISGVVIAVLAAIIIGEGRFSPKNSEPDNYSNVDNSREEQQEYQEPRATSTPMPESSPTPSGIRNPKEPVKAGEQVLVGDFGLFVKRDFKIGARDWVEIFPVLTNFGGNTKLFSFTNSSIKLTDNLGNTYVNGCEESLYVIKQSDFSPGEVEEFNPNGYSCTASDSFGNINSFKGPISPNATQLIVTFDGFGVFNNVQFIIDL